MQLSELASYLKAEVFLPPGCQKKDPVIKKISPIDIAKEEEVTFVSNPDYAKYISQTKASAIILKESNSDCSIPQLIHNNPHFAFAKTAMLFHKPAPQIVGISDHASIAEDAVISDGVTIYPYSCVGSKSEIGAKTILYSSVSIASNVKIGKNCVIHANATIYDGTQIGDNVIIHAGCVIGADGFGYAVGDGEIVKIPQVGKVVIEDHVEIGANTSVDRAAMGQTKIGRGTKLDSCVQVGHNVEIGENCMISAFTGLAGSCKLGNWIVMGGQSGANGHIEIADGTQIGGRAGIVKSIKEKGTYLGFPEIPAGEWRRRQVYLRKLARIRCKVKGS